MSHVTAGAVAVLDALTAAGIRATLDPRNLHPPAVIITPGHTDRLTTARVRQSLDVTMVAPGPANLDALRALDKLTAAVSAALDAAGLPWTAGDFAMLDGPGAGEPLLTYALTLTRTQEA